MKKENYYEKTGLLIPDILLPKKDVDMTKWAVVACDQFTSSPDYWNEVEEVVKDAPSTLRLTLPEIYLGGNDEEERIKKINEDMHTYITSGVFQEPKTGVILVKRDLGDGLIRTGFLAALNLDKYDFAKGSKTLIRATEGTVLSRIPPRMKVRKNADVELPHVLMLINDKENKVIEDLEKAPMEKVYDFDLMEKGGHVTGYLISDETVLNELNKNLESLITDDGLLYAVGDGNHSFAAAKSHWENLKKAGTCGFNPAGFCMCEIENIHDTGIVFEPIHRVLFDTDFDRFTDLLYDYFVDNVSTVENFDNKDIRTPKDDNGCPYHEITIFTKDRLQSVYISKDVGTLAVGVIQDFIDKALKDVKIDYVHDMDEVVNVVEKNENSIGILLPPPKKSGLFEVVEKGDVLPRKTFSMGDARTKRYYIEARSIKE